MSDVVERGRLDEDGNRGVWSVLYTHYSSR